MDQIGTRIDETGMLLQEAEGSVLRRDAGGRWRLDLHRAGSDLGEGRVRVTGTVVGPDLIDVDGVSLEDELGVAA